MKAAIRYYTRGGNTEKLALAISKATGLPAETIDVPLLEDVDILFLGSSVYGFDVDDQVKQFISRAISATTGAAPVPVPPPIPAVTNTRSAPFSA